MSRRQYIDGVDLSQPQPPVRPAQDDPGLRVSRPSTESAEQPHQLVPKARRLTFTKHLSLKTDLALCGIVLLIALGGILAHHQLSQQKIVPKALASHMPFPIYYPDPKKLPAGYTIDESSFNSPAKDVVLYAVDYSGGKLVFSVQPKPAAADLNNFNNQRIPLHTTLHTPNGTAVIGALGNQSVVSLPTNSNAWVIVTGPYATNQTKLAQVLRAMKPAR